MRKLDFALLTLSLGLILISTLALPPDAQAEDQGGNWGCFICDDWYKEAEDEWWHRDFPLTNNDKKGIKHWSPILSGCDFHLNYSQ